MKQGNKVSEIGNEGILVQKNHNGCGDSHLQLCGCAFGIFEHSRRRISSISRHAGKTLTYIHVVMETCSDQYFRQGNGWPQHIADVELQDIYV